MQRRKLFVTVAVLALCFFAVLATRFVTGPRGRILFPQKAAERSRGKPTAPLWIVEYTDFQCPACREAAAVLKDTLRQHPSEIYLQLRYHPQIRSHQLALKSAIYADCASRQRKFWEFQDILYERQPEWAASQDPDALFLEYAWRLGLDVRRLVSCVGDERIRKKIVAERDESSGLGVTSTPTFFINGKMTVGAQALKSELEAYFSSRKGGEKNER